MTVTIGRSRGKQMDSLSEKPMGGECRPGGNFIARPSKARCPGRLAEAGPLCSWHCGGCGLASGTSRNVSCPSQWPLSHCPRWSRSLCHSGTLAGLCSVWGRWARVLRRRLSSPWICNAPCTQLWKQEGHTHEGQGAYRTGGEREEPCLLPLQWSGTHLIIF